MTTVTFTAQADPGSSAIDDLYYNENTQELTVDLDDRIYRYSGVPKDEYYTFLNAASAGNHYGGYFKRTYGPGEFIGDWDEISFEREAVKSQSIGTPQNFVHTGQTLVTNVVASNTANYSLTAPASTNTRDHVVKFVANGAERVHTVKTTTVDEAVKAINDIAAMLDLTFTVKSVTVNFE